MGDQALRIVLCDPAKGYSAGCKGSWVDLAVALTELDTAYLMLEWGVSETRVAAYLGKTLSELGSRYLGLFGPKPRRIHGQIFGVQSSDIYNSRNACIAPQKDELKPYPRNILEWTPFNSKLEYTHILWIDSDMIFSVEDVLRITSHEADIVSGMCLVSPTQYHFGYTGKLEEGAFISYLNIWAEEEWLKDKQWPDGLVPIDYCGGAFLCVRKGVYEAMPYPWYRTTQWDNHGTTVEASEDIGWTHRAKEAGFELFVDPKVRIGHEKTWALTPPAMGQAVALADGNGKPALVEVEA